MKWFKKNPSSDPLESEKQRLDEELQEIQRKIQTAMTKKGTAAEPRPSPYARMPVVRTDAPNHMGTLSPNIPEEPVLKTTSPHEEVPLRPDTEYSPQGKFNPWPLWRKVQGLFRWKRSASSTEHSQEESPIFNLLEGVKLKKTRREIMIIRRRIFLLISVFLLILWGIFLMFLKP